MTKENVIKLLSEVKYPGFNRDIVSFGMVKDITIDNETVTIQLNVTSQNNEKKDAVKESVKEKLSSSFKAVIVNISQDNMRERSPESPHVHPTVQVLEKVKHIVAVASGKGGVGKSTIAANLACAFSRQGKKVGLLDLDIYGPSLPIILGFNEQPKMTVDKKLIPLKRFGMEVMSFGFISGNDTPTIWRGPLVARMTEQFFHDVNWGQLDLMILDLPPGTGDVQLTLTQKLKISGAIIITTPQDIALADVRKGADMFKKVNTPILGVIENMSGYILDGLLSDYSGSTININGENIPINEDGSFKLKLDLFKKDGGEKESNRLGVPLLGQIPISPLIMSATDEGIPIVEKDPRSSEAKPYINIAELISSSLS